MKIYYAKWKKPVIKKELCWQLYKMSRLDKSIETEWLPTADFLPGEIPRTEEPGRLQSRGSQKKQTQKSLFGGDLERHFRVGGSWQDLVRPGVDKKEHYPKHSFQHES